MLALACLLQVGCGVSRVNPSFSITRDEAQADIERMERDVASLERPLLTLTGWGDPGFDSADMKRRVEKVANGRPVVPVARR